MASAEISPAAKIIQRAARLDIGKQAFIDVWRRNAMGKTNTGHRDKNRDGQAKFRKLINGMTHLNANYIWHCRDLPAPS